MKRIYFILFALLFCSFSLRATTPSAVDSFNTETNTQTNDSLAILATNTLSDKEDLSLIQVVEKWYEDNMNYYSITALMAIESSFIPFPSEIVIPPAAYIASKPNSELNIFLVVLFGTLGALIGALINYYLALWLGRPLLYKFADSKVGHVLLLSKEKVMVAEEYFVKNGKISTLVGRLIPAVRQLISLPAGLAKMNIFHFMLFTVLGAGLWNSVLALLGYIAQGQQDLIEQYSHELSVIIVILFVVVVGFLIIRKICKKRKQK